MLRSNFKVVDDEFQYAKSIDGTTTEEIQEALEESIKGNLIFLHVLFSLVYLELSVLFGCIF